MDKTRIRIRFSKCDDLRWISHRDLARVWERLLRRAGLELAFSEGFHPKPRISFPSALALGVEALDEIVEMELIGAIDVDKIEAAIREQLLPGMSLHSVEALAQGLGKAKVVGMHYRLPVADERRPALQQRIEEVLASDEIVVQREKRSVSCATADPNFALTLDEHGLQFSIPNAADGALRPSELLEYVGLGDCLEAGDTLQRVGVKLLPPKTAAAES